MQAALRAVTAAFHDNFQLGLECGASLSIWHDGREILSLAKGFLDHNRSGVWTADTPVLVWSVSKGPSSAALVHALERSGVPLHLPVAAVWPGFEAAGKTSIRISDVLSHRAGLAALVNRNVPFDDRGAVAAEIARQAPLWEPRSAHGYGARIFGYILDEICQRVAGMRIGPYWKTTFAEPMNLDFWIGIPPEEQPRAAKIFAPRLQVSAAAQNAFERAIAEPGSLTQMAFSTPAGLSGVSTCNKPEVQQTGYPAFGGIGTASALAKFYSMLACGGELDGRRYFSHETVKSFQRRAVDGFDLVLQRETAFSTGFMLDPLHNGKKIRSIFGPSLHAFGHPGAGGSLAFADPENRLGFAYVMNQMEPGALPRERTLRLVRDFYNHLGGDEDSGFRSPESGGSLAQMSSGPRL